MVVLPNTTRGKTLNLKLKERDCVPKVLLNIFVDYETLGRAINILTE
jgi:hypothetical protein